MEENFFSKNAVYAVVDERDASLIFFWAKCNIHCLKNISLTQKRTCGIYLHIQNNIWKSKTNWASKFQCIWIHLNLMPRFKGYFLIFQSYKRCCKITYSSVKNSTLASEVALSPLCFFLHTGISQLIYWLINGFTGSLKFRCVTYPACKAAYFRLF